MKAFVYLLLTVLVVGAGWLAWEQRREDMHPEEPVIPNNTTAEVFYQCDRNQSIIAKYYAMDTEPPGTSGPAGEEPGRAAEPGLTSYGAVDLSLSDGRLMKLTRMISADGLRFSNAGGPDAAEDQVTFWTTGNSAFIVEDVDEDAGNHEDLETYEGCIRVVPDPGGLLQIYANAERGFSIRYPTEYRLDENHHYLALSPDENIHGVRFLIPENLATKTNLDADTYLSVERLEGKATCTADEFLSRPVNPGPEMEGTIQYSMATSEEAGAGNRYEETVYAIPGTEPCTAIRYFIHFNIIENYPAGVVQEFDKEKLIQEFDDIRRTLVLK